MAKRTGESLIEQGLITAQQLEEALNAQLIYGGHLGTCLIELGFIEEEALGKFLAGSFSVDYATVDMLTHVKPGVIKSVPQAIVEKYQLVPMSLTGKVLAVAMVNPADLQALDEISFATGFKIEPWVAPEVRVFQAMESYYDIPRRLRYITLGGRLDSGRNAKARPTDRASSMPASVPPPAVETMADLAPMTATAVAEPTLVATLDASATCVGGDLSSLSAHLCRVTTGEEIVASVLSHVESYLERSVVFKIKATNAVIWGLRGFEMAPEQRAAVALPITREPLFQLLRGKPCFRGPIPEDGAYDSFYRVMGIDRPAEALLFPVYYNDRIVALLYGDAGGDCVIDAETDHFRRVTQKIALTLEMLLLQKRIRQA